MEKECLVTSSQLRTLLDSDASAGGSCILVIDCRPFTAFNTGHISGAQNVHCPPIVKRRSGGCIPFANVVRSPDVRSALEQGLYSMIIVYDEKSWSVSQLSPDSDTRLSIDAIKKSNLTSNATLRLLKGKNKIIIVTHLCVVGGVKLNSLDVFIQQALKIEVRGKNKAICYLCLVSEGFLKLKDSLS